MAHSEKTRKRTISSRLTPLFKFAPPILWLVWIGSSLPNIITKLLAHKALSIQHWLMLVAWIVGSPAIFWFCTKLKKVVIDYSGKLLISNYREVIEVKMEDIKNISGTTAFNPHTVWFSMHKPSKFGGKVIFFAKSQSSMFQAHWQLSVPPLAYELQSLVSLAKGK